MNQQRKFFSFTMNSNLLQICKLSGWIWINSMSLTTFNRSRIYIRAIFSFALWKTATSGLIHQFSSWTRELQRHKKKVEEQKCLVFLLSFLISMLMLIHCVERKKNWKKFRVSLIPNSLALFASVLSHTSASFFFFSVSDKTRGFVNTIFHKRWNVLAWTNPQIDFPHDEMKILKIRHIFAWLLKFISQTGDIYLIVDRYQFNTQFWNINVET